MKSVPNEAAWRAIMSLAHARSVAKARETELVTTRKDLEGQLDALGAGSTREHLEVSRNYVITLRSIDHFRDRMRSLADQLEKAINDSSQGKFEFAEDVDDRELVKKPSETDLFHVTPAPEAKPKDARPVGRHNTPEVPAPAVAQGENQHLIASVNELDCIDKLKGKLIDAGYTTMGALFAIIEHDDIEANKLSEAVNVTGAAARTIVAAAKKWQKAHRKASLAAEKEAAGG
jgi:hypothetical protein